MSSPPRPGYNQYILSLGFPCGSVAQVTATADKKTKTATFDWRSGDLSFEGKSMKVERRESGWTAVDWPGLTIPGSGFRLQELDDLERGVPLEEWMKVDNSKERGIWCD